MDPMTIGLAAGLGKSLLFDAPKAERDRKLQATTATLSPWTGMQATGVQEPDMFGSALQGGMAGAQFSQANPGFNAVPTPGAAPALSPEQVAGRAAENSYQMPAAPNTFMSNAKTKWDLPTGQRYV